MDILSGIISSQHIQITLLIVLIGIALQTWKGLINKSIFDLSIRHVGFGIIVAILTSYHIVLPQIQAVPEGTTPEMWSTIIIGGILTVMGGASVSKGIAKYISKDTGDTKQ